MFKLGTHLSNLTKIEWMQKFPVSDDDVINQLSLYPEQKIVPHSKVFTIGSCFARNVEESLAGAGFSVPMLNFSVPEDEWEPAARRNGILNRYTPQNIYQTIRWAYKSAFVPNGYRSDTERFMIHVDGGVIDADLSGFIPVTEERFWDRRKEMLNVFEQLFDSDYVIITLGQTEAWYYEPNQVFWSRIPATRALRPLYDETRHSIADSESTYRMIRESIKMIHSMNRDSKIILSVSPVAADTFWQDGNALLSYWQTKLTLLDAAKRLVWDLDEVYYFPSFEAVHTMESPWEPDRMHVNKQTIDKIVKRIL